MTSAQPPSNGDRPAEGQEAAPQEAAPQDARQVSPAAKRTTARRTPAARKPGDFDTQTKRAPSTRKRSTAAAFSPNGEAPEILDAMLGRPVPVVEGAEPPEPETETAVLPSAADSSHERTAETEVLAPATAAIADEHPDEPQPAQPQPAQPQPAQPQPAQPQPAQPQPAQPQEGVPSPADEAPAAPLAEEAGGTSAGSDAPGATRHARSVNELADRLDDSRFFSSLFDFTFTSYVTRKLAGPVYVVGLVLIGLGIVVGFANSLGIAIAADSPGGAFVFLLGVLVTLVAAILAVLLLRVTIEVFCAIIEIAQNTRRRRPPRD